MFARKKCRIWQSHGAAVLWDKMPCWCQRGMSRILWVDCKAAVTEMLSCYNHGMQKSSSVRLEAVVLAEDTGWYFCQLETGTWSYSSHRFNRRLDKCCLVWWIPISAVMSQFAVSNMKAWDHPALYRCFRRCNRVGNIFLAGFRLLMVSGTWSQTRPQSNRASLGCTANKSAITVWWCHVDMD